MPRLLLALALVAVTLSFAPAPATPVRAAALEPAAAALPTHALELTGTDVDPTDMYPAFGRGTERYAVRTTGATNGSLSVKATTTDPAGRIWVNGRRTTGDITAVSGLQDGDEISVIFSDSGGRAVHSVVYLPAGFPALGLVVKKPGLAKGDVLLTLSQYTGQSTNFEAAINRDGVPSFVRASFRGITDLKRAANGHYSIARNTRTPGRTGADIEELNSRFNVIRTYSTVGLTDTDDHDSILRPDGSRVHVAYVQNPVSGKTDAVIQDVSATGEVVFQWNSKNHVDVVNDPVGGGADYAHINSIWEMKDGDFLASFRHLSQVLKIARRAHDGFARGEVVWRLGGRRSDFTFVDAVTQGGPCAQHTASELENGHILIFDNGSWQVDAVQPLCVDPTNPFGPTVDRPNTRITEYALTPPVGNTLGTAKLAWSYQPPGLHAIFAGSAQRLPNGNTLANWAAAPNAVATEVNPAGEVLWEIKDLDDPNYFSYRADLTVVRDATKPVVDVDVPAAGARYTFGQQVVSSFGCTDRGGASLQSCGFPSPSGSLVDTSSSGTHTFTVRGVDGAGNVTAVTRSYRVVGSPYRPDGMIRKRPGGALIGRDVYGGSRRQLIRLAIPRTGGRASALVRLQNDGSPVDRITVRGTAGSRAFEIRYFAGGQDVTRRVTAGTYRTPRLLPGQTAALLVKVTRTSAADVGDRRRIRVRGTSVRDPGLRDIVAAVVRATR